MVLLTNNHSSRFNGDDPIGDYWILLIKLFVIFAFNKMSAIDN